MADGNTAKKGQCSVSPLKGECYCKRHLKQQSEAPKQDVPKPVKPEPKKAAAKVAPVHEHEIDDEKHASCDLCQTHGTALVEEQEFEEADEEDEEEPEALGWQKPVESDAESGDESGFDEE